MNTYRFDALTRSIAAPASRRSALHLLAASFLGALIPGRTAFAQRPDRDADGLFDDDETEVYGTNPDNPDTDGDGDDDGSEVYNSTDPLTPIGGGQAPPISNCPPGGPGTDCGGYCASVHSDPLNCGGCGIVCPTGASCVGGACTAGCAPGETFCYGACVTLAYNSLNCGACGAVCASPGVCVEGECRTFFEGCGAYDNPCTTNAQCCGDLICLQVQGGGICRPHP